MSSARFLPYGRQEIDAADITAVVESLQSDYLTTGPRVEAFETALAKYSGAQHAVAVSNGTAALHLAMLAAAPRPGQRVLTSPFTFLASANCAEFVGATADFADIDPHLMNLTPETIDAAWQDDVRAVVAVDFAGQPCAMPEIAGVARARGAVVIEDAAHAIGSEFEHGGSIFKVGGHGWADMTTLSFHPVKMITSGEGGAILTNDPNLADRCRLFRNHGMIKDSARFTGIGAAQSKSSGLAEAGPWYYEMAELGYNYRITDLQCALGLSQLGKIDRFKQRRAAIVARYNAAFAGLTHARCPQIGKHIPAVSSVAWHLYVLQIDFETLGKTRTEVMSGLRQRGIGTQVHYIPVHLQPYYQRKYGYAVGKCPIAEACYLRCLSLPLFPSMTDVEVQRVIEGVQAVLS